MDEADLKRLLDVNAAETRGHFDAALANVATRADLESAIASTTMQGEATRRHFDIVAEGLRRELQIVAEGVTGNTEKIERLDEKVDRIFSNLDQRLTRIEVTSSR